MEKHPVRETFRRTRQRLGQMVIEGLERFDDSHDVFSDDELQDTQPFDTAELLRRLKEDGESHIVRGEE